VTRRPPQEAPEDIYLTTEVARFVERLLPGDLLLFDTLHPVGALIKFAENRPVSHCAVHIKCGAYLNATGGDADRKAVQPGTVEERFASPRERTVTALRHHDADKDLGAEWAVERAKAIREESDKYAYLNIVSIAPACFVRAYVSPASGLLAPMVRLLGGIADTFIDDLALASERKGSRAADQRQTLTCSEFAYKALHAPGDHRKVLVENSIAFSRLADDLRAGPRHRGPAEANEFLMDGVELVFNAAFFQPSAAEPLLPWEEGRVRAPDAKAFVSEGVRQVLRILGYNSTLGKYRRPAVRGDALVPDVVTPGDLWGSRSFRTVAVLHRPPGEQDEELSKQRPAQPERGSQTPLALPESDWPM
jgi:hypothetical protein